VLIEDESERRGLEEELVRECASTEHPLYGVEVRAIARCVASDDVLYELPGSGRLAIVHLTWSRETDPHWPGCDFFDD